MRSWRWLSSFAAVLAIVECSGDDKPSVAKARDFKAYNVWWLGEDFEGFELSNFELSNAEEASFLYGTCKPSSDAGCAPPVQVIVRELCSFPPLDFEPSGLEEVLREGATLLPIREGQVLVKTGTAAITLFGPDDATTRRMAQRLESLNIEPYVASGESLPSPVICGKRKPAIQAQ